MTKCFISHSWRDGGHDFALRLKEALRARDVDAWLDEKEILPAQHVEQRMVAGVIHECDVFLFVLSPASLESQGCAIELREALKQRGENGLQIIPIMFRTCRIPPKLKSLLYVDFRDEATFDKSIRQLLPGIQAASHVRSLVARLTRGDPGSRAEAAQELGNLRNPFTVPVLARPLCEDADPDPTVRYWLAHALGQIGGKEACAALRACYDKEIHPFPRLGIEDALEKACKPAP